MLELATRHKRLLLVVFIVLGILALAYLGVRDRTEPIEEPEIIIETEVEWPEHEIIGSSVEARAINAYAYGSGDTKLLFVGGIHGGYEWNSVLLAYQLMDYIEENPDIIPSNVTVTVVPSANPDGLFEVIKKEGRFSIADVPDDTVVVGTGRFNAHGVDLNRNFDCKWKEDALWRGNVVSAGTGPFSEPESKAIRDFVLEHKPKAVVFWHSQANAVFASECKDGILPETLTLMNTYSDSAAYPAVESFDAYEVNGDAEGWLASINIPAITVELSTHEAIEWEKNLKGVEAVLGLFGEPALSR